MMSSKQWFILKTDHHIGPLSTEQISEQFQSSLINKTQPLWSEGDEDWRELKDIKDFAHLFADLPPLPDLPDLPALPDLPQIPEVFEFPDLPPLPEVSHEISEKKNPTASPKRKQKPKQKIKQIDDKEQAPQELGDDEFWDDKLEATDEKSPGNMTKWILAIVFCLLAFALSLTFIKQAPIEPVFHELRVQDAERLKAFLRVNKNKLNKDQMPFAFSLSRDGRGLMVVSPYPEEAKLYLELKSLKGRVLSFEDLSMSAEANLKNHQAWFKELQLNSGISLSPGYYQYTLTAVPVGPIARLRRFLQQNGMAKGAIERFSASAEVLLIREDEQEFQQKLSEHVKKLKEAQLRPLQERMQQYQTLQQMAQQILAIYQEVLPDVKKAEDLKVFETRYSQSVGRLLQTLILEAHQQAQELKNSQVEESYTYEHLRDFGRNVGELVSDMVTTTEQTRDLDEKKKSRLLRQFESRVKELQAESKRRQLVIESEIQKLPQ